jgi:lipopolysaccharide/colanic/teichoic acid biosynthesis glycosyltransferase
MIRIYLVVKWLFDKLLSLALLILLSPVFLFFILILYLFNDKDIFYLQNRVGYSNHIFRIIKFTTMAKDSETSPDGSVVLRGDPRVTGIGKILRITKLNELPQLLNVFIGNMSFVGPRPMTRSGFELYNSEVKSKIYNSKPGITGISSIIFRDEEKWVSSSDLEPMEFYKQFIFPYKGQLELWYLKNKSISTDFLILFLTALKIVFPQSKLEFKIFSSLPKSDYFIF